MSEEKDELERLLGRTRKTVLGDLTEREQAVLKMRFGLGQDIEDLEDNFRKTREKIRAIEERALEKLKRPNSR